MTTSYTSLLGLALPATGELSGTWGSTVNTEITALLDSAIAGTTTLSTDADVTLTTTTGAANTSRQAILLCSGARTVLRTITAPAQSKIYTIINATTGGFSVKLVGAGPTTGVTVVAGESAVCAWNGSDFIKISNTAGVGTFTNLTVTGTLGVTGVATLGNGAILGTPTSGTVTNLTGTASININGTVGATTASSGAFTTLSATGVTTVQAGTAALPAITTTGDTNTGIFFPAADTIAFSEGGVEAMRIDSSGRVIVGGSNINGRIQSITPASYTESSFRADSATAASTNWNHFYGTSSSNSVANIIIYGNGNIQNANNSYGSLSDSKLKENIVDATPKLDKLMQVRVRNYNLKGAYEQHKQLGVVAQELETVFPSMVDETPDKDAEGNDIGTKTKSVKYSVFVPMLIKAMQEQQDLIIQLQADVAVLKGA